MWANTPYYFRQSGCGFLDVSPGKGMRMIIIRTTGHTGITVSQKIYCSHRQYLDGRRQLNFPD